LAEIGNVIGDVGKSFVKEPPPPKRIDQQIGGKILLAATALQTEDFNRALDAEQSAETSAGLLPISSAEDMSRDEPARLVYTLRLGGPDSSAIFSLRDAALWGIEFRLPTIYQHEDRVSFVFLLCANPALNGLIVQVEGNQQCQQFQSEVVRKADWFLHDSSIHLRYRFEEWADFLLGWIKHFYIPNLRYWRYDSLPNYEWLFAKTDPSDMHQRDKMFGLLKESVVMEYRGWPHLEGDTDRMSFWQKLNALGTLARLPPHLLR
jgi:hypothetical protein